MTSPLLFTRRKVTGKKKKNYSIITQGREKRKGRGEGVGRKKKILLLGEKINEHRTQTSKIR